MSKVHIWLRAETKPHEQRTALSPKGAKTLVDAGFKVTVECSAQNIFWCLYLYEAAGGGFVDHVVKELLSPQGAVPDHPEAVNHPRSDR